MDTIYTYKVKRKFLSLEQERSLIDLLTFKCSREIKQQIGLAIRTRFFSLPNKPYWDKINVHDVHVDFKGVRTEIKQIRKDILASLNSQTNVIK